VLTGRAVAREVSKVEAVEVDESTLLEDVEEVVVSI
jgi:hypothetical protein